MSDETRTPEIEDDAAAKAAAADPDDPAKGAVDPADEPAPPAPKSELEEPTDEEWDMLHDEERAEYRRLLAEDEPEPEPEPGPEAKAPEPDPEPAPPPEIPDASEARAAIEKLEADREKLRESFEDGETSREDLRARQKEIDDALIEARVTVARADDAISAHRKAEGDRWYGLVDRHLAEDSPYAFLGADEHIEGFDRALKRVTDPAGDYAAFDMPQQINLATAIYIAEAKALGKDVPDPSDPAPTAKPKDDRIERRSDDRPAPRTLSRIPASDPSANDAPFAGLDRIIDGDDPFQAEAAFESLSPEAQERALRGA